MNHIEENKIEEKKLPPHINPVIHAAIENNFYGLDNESFFLQKIIAPIAVSRDRYKVTNRDDDRKLLRAYFDKIPHLLIPTEDFLKQIAFIGDTKNNDLQNEITNNLNKLFTTKFTMWAISKSDEKMAKILSLGLTKGINNGLIEMKDIIENMSLLENEDNKDKKILLLSEIYLTKDSASYLLLDKYISLESEHKKIIVEKILIKNTEALLLNRELVKEIYMEPIMNSDWGMVDSYIRNLGVNKLDFLLDILMEVKKENPQSKDQKKINTAIYKLIDKALYLKRDDLMDRLIDIKKENKDLTGEDIYVLMIKRFYSYLKKEKAEQYCEKLLLVAQNNHDFDNLKSILFSQKESFKIEPLGMDLNLKDDYLRKQMKQHFMNYLQEKLKPKSISVKPNKI